jgi:hypothetical protein
MTQPYAASYRDHEVSATLLALPWALGLAAGGASAANLIQNSGFATAAPTSQVIEGAYAPVFGVWEPTTVYNWTASGTYDLVVYPGQGDDTSDLINGFALYGPKNGYNNGLTDTGPGGGNYVALDGDFPGAFSQTIGGLVNGQKYTLSFYYAGAQEINAPGDTVENLTASLGDLSFVAPTLNTPNAGFSPWRLESFSFTYDGSGNVLSFLSVGEGVPPYALINDPTLTTSGVPEASTWAMIIAGFAGLGLLARTRRKTATLAA